MMAIKNIFTANNKRKGAELALRFFGISIFHIPMIAYKEKNPPLAGVLALVEMFYLTSLLWWANKKLVTKPENIKRGKRAVGILFVFTIVLAIFFIYMVFLRKSYT